MKGNLFNYQEVKDFNELKDMVSRLSKDLALVKLDLNNFKKDFEDYKRVRLNGM